MKPKDTKDSISFMKREKLKKKKNKSRRIIKAMSKSVTFSDKVLFYLIPHGSVPAFTGESTQFFFFHFLNTLPFYFSFKCCLTCFYSESQITALMNKWTTHSGKRKLIGNKNNANFFLLKRINIVQWDHCAPMLWALGIINYDLITQQQNSLQKFWFWFSFWVTSLWFEGQKNCAHSAPTRHVLLFCSPLHPSLFLLYISLSHSLTLQCPTICLWEFVSPGSALCIISLFFQRPEVADKRATYQPKHETWKPVEIAAIGICFCRSTLCSEAWPAGQRVWHEVTKISLVKKQHILCLYACSK